MGKNKLRQNYNALKSLPIVKQLIRENENLNQRRRSSYLALDFFFIRRFILATMIAMFDNLRLLHGRTKFDPNTGFRHLQGCYIDHDVTEGKLRRLVKS